MAHSAILNTRPRSASTPHLRANEADRRIQAIDEARARQDHEDFLALVDNEIRPAMRAFEVLLHLDRIGCRIETQGLCGHDAFRGTSTVALHILLGSQLSGGSKAYPRLECVRSRRHPGEVILVASRGPGPGGTSGRMRRYDQITYGLVFDLLEQLLEEVRGRARQARRSAGTVVWV